MKILYITLGVLSVLGLIALIAAIGIGGSALKASRTGITPYE